jgi:hypothetical protein
MNPRIKTLAEQAGLGFDPNLIVADEPIYFVTQVELEKFAELVLLECARIVKASSPQGMVGVNAIRIHFGIEP